MPLAAQQNQLELSHGKGCSSGSLCLHRTVEWVGRKEGSRADGEAGRVARVYGMVIVFLALAGQGAPASSHLVSEHISSLGIQTKERVCANGSTIKGSVHQLKQPSEGETMVLSFPSACDCQLQTSQFDKSDLSSPERYVSMYVYGYIFTQAGL